MSGDTPQTMTKPTPETTEVGTMDKSIASYGAVISGLLALVILGSSPRYVIGLVGCVFLGICIAMSCQLFGGH
jgi:hypothetical protein